MGGQRRQCPSQFLSSQVNEIFQIKANEILQCKSTKLPQETFLLQLLVEYKLVSELQAKTIGVTLFATVSGTPACCTHLLVMQASFQDHRKFLLSQPWVLQI